MTREQQFDWRHTLVVNTRGNIAVMLALITPALFLIVGGAIDFASTASQRSRLQAVVDEAALSAARELGLADAKRESVSAAVHGRVMQQCAQIVA